eukprot:1147146-Pelagomonas_calceolata.AAC.9
MGAKPALTFMARPQVHAKQCGQFAACITLSVHGYALCVVCDWSGWLSSAHSDAGPQAGQPH